MRVVLKISNANLVIARKIKYGGLIKSNNFYFWERI